MDGLISLEEAIMTTDDITIFDEFNEVDIENNGFVQKSLTPPLKSRNCIEKRLNKFNLLPAGAEYSSRHVPSKLYFSFLFFILC